MIWCVILWPWSQAGQVYVRHSLALMALLATQLKLLKSTLLIAAMKMIADLAGNESWLAQPSHVVLCFSYRQTPHEDCLLTPVSTKVDAVRVCKTTKLPSPFMNCISFALWN